jgi:anti-anti-sigma factor
LSKVVNGQEEDNVMSVDADFNQRGDFTVADRTASGGRGHSNAGPAGGSRLRVQLIEPVAIVRFTASDFLVGDTVAREVIGQLEDLVKARGHARLLLNFEGVRYLSSKMLAALAGLGEEMGRRGGRIQFCGLNPLMRDLLRMTHLDHLFDLCADEAEALGILVR